MTEIVFKKDQFLQFRATKEIALGGIRPQSGYRTFVGEIVEFDGFKLIVGSGESTEAPHLRAAINAGWFVPHDGSDVEYPVEASEPAAPVPTSKIPLLRYEEQIVASRTGDGFQATPHPQPSAAARLLNQFNQQAAQEQAPPVQEPGGRRKFALTRQEEFEGEGIPIARLRPQVQEIPTQVGAEGIYEDQKSISSFNPSVRTKGGVALEESAQVRKGSTDSVIMGQAAVVGTNKDSTPQQVRKMTMRTAEDQEGVPVSRLRTPTSFGETQINSTTGTKIAEIERQARVVPGTVVHSEEVVAESKKAGDQDAALLANLQAMVPGFAWNKARPVSKRLAEAKKVADPMMRRAILIYEGAGLQEALQKLWG